MALRTSTRNRFQVEDYFFSCSKKIGTTKNNNDEVDEKNLKRSLRDVLVCVKEINRIEICLCLQSSIDEQQNTYLINFQHYCYDCLLFTAAMKFLLALLALLLALSAPALLRIDAFVVVPSPISISTYTTTTLFASSAEDASSSSIGISIGNGLKKGDPVLLVGPGFLQLVLAKHLARSGLKPIVIAPQKKLDNYFKSFLKNGLDTEEDGGNHVGDEDIEGIHKQIQNDSTIGMPEINDPYFGELKGVIFCSEDAVLSPEIVANVLDFKDQGLSPFASDNDNDNNNDGSGNGKAKRVICCLPVSNKVVKEKSNSWIPVFNMSEKKQDDIWLKFTNAYKNHPSFKSNDSSGSIVRYGSLFGGSVDGPPVLMDYGLDEGIYKMSMEQYRDMRERAFDRYKLSGQCLMGDSINEKPLDQESKEKDALKEYPNNVREMFTILGNYPEIDRTNRHTIASGITQLLLLDTTGTENTTNTVPKEITILSKASSEMNTPNEWKDMLTNPSTTGGSEWPDPTKFEPEKYGIEKESSDNKEEKKKGFF